MKKAKRVYREKKTKQPSRRRPAKVIDDIAAPIEVMLREANEKLVVAAINAQEMSDAAVQVSEQMTYMAEHDYLTGLPNRVLLIDRLKQAIAHAQRDGKKVSLLYLDLDHFKHINDSLGHTIGDQLLQSVAMRLKECIRSSDTVSRQGGDEFVVLLADIEAVEGVILTVEKVIASMHRPHHIENQQLHVTLSIGISLYPDDATDIDTMIKNADTAMYHAKKKGRNNYQIFSQAMKVQAGLRQSLEQALHHAIEHDEFVLHYQPKVNLVTGVITGAEALLRWQTQHRIISPTQFVSIAEDCGLIVPIGRWVMREACSQAHAWLKSGLKLGQMAVNVSAKEFHDNGFLAVVRDILNDTGLSPHHLEIEVTESGLMHHTEQTLKILYSLKELGVHIAIDDFGTGYSSLSYLRRFPIDTLKIDLSFVHSINGDASDPIVSYIIAMAMSFKQGVVAEGIETQQQFDFLQKNHCAEGQGFYFSQPVVAEELAILLETERAFSS